MNQLETTVLKSARHQLDELQRALAQPWPSERQKDAVSAAYWKLNGLMTLTNAEDSGLSQEAVGELHAIEYEGAKAMAEKSDDDEVRISKLMLIAFVALGITAFVLAIVGSSWVMGGASALSVLIGLGGFLFSRRRNKLSNLPQGHKA